MSSPAHLNGGRAAATRSSGSGVNLNAGIVRMIGFHFVRYWAKTVCHDGCLRPETDVAGRGSPDGGTARFHLHISSPRPGTTSELSPRPKSFPRIAYLGRPGCIQSAFPNTDLPIPSSRESALVALVPQLHFVVSSPTESEINNLDSDFPSHWCFSF